jgi:hypothetical protein
VAYGTGGFSAAVKLFRDLIRRNFSEDEVGSYRVGFFSGLPSIFAALNSQLLIPEVKYFVGCATMR